MRMSRPFLSRSRVRSVRRTLGRGDRYASVFRPGDELCRGAGAGRETFEVPVACGP